MLGKCVNIGGLRKSLADLPEGVHTMYAATMERVEKEDNAELAKRALTWLVYSARSLEIEELRHAIAIDSITCKFDPDELIDQATLVSLCCGLITVDPETKLARLIRRYFPF